MTPEERQTYYKLMNAACDAMIQASEMLQSNILPEEKIKLREFLEQRAIQLQNIAMKLADSASADQHNTVILPRPVCSTT